MKQFKPVVFALGVAFCAYALHKLLVFYFDGLQIQNPVHSLEMLYLFFIFCTVCILILLIKISRKSFDNVGMVFLIATSAKMVLCYLMLRPILKLTDETLRVQKISFFILFILFLAIETVITIRILNNKQ